MNDAIFVAGKAGGRLTIGDKNEISKVNLSCSTGPSSSRTSIAIG